MHNNCWKNHFIIWTMGHLEWYENVGFLHVNSRLINWHSEKFHAHSASNVHWQSTVDSTKWAERQCIFLLFFYINNEWNSTVFHVKLMGYGGWIKMQIENRHSKVVENRSIAALCVQWHLHLLPFTEFIFVCCVCACLRHFIHCIYNKD